MGRILSGVQPTGNLHLGNYLGAIRNWVNLQASHECFFSVVDLHAITVPQDPAALRSAVLETAATYVACGIDPKKSAIFRQSSLRQVSELHWLLSCTARTGWLDRMTQFKDKMRVDYQPIITALWEKIGWVGYREGSPGPDVDDDDLRLLAEQAVDHFLATRDSTGAGLYTYPILMAADILAMQATHVPVGDDQRQHLQLTRQIAQSFNHHHGEIFTIPEDLILGEAPRVMSLRFPDKKMSKSEESDQGRINLTDTADAIAQKVKRATTDSERLPSEPAGLKDRPGAENLLRIWAALQNKTLEAACQEFGGQGFGKLKPAVSDLLVETIVPIGDQIRGLLTHPSDLEEILHNGWVRAAPVAEETVMQTQAALGLR